MRRASLLLPVLLLVGCGNEQNLRPPNGAELPPKAASSPTRPTAAELLKPSPQARPSRSDELLTKSEKRTDDPFDQPPK